MDKIIVNKPGRSTIAPTVNEENLANKKFLLAGLHREMLPSQEVMHYNAARSH